MVNTTNDRRSQQEQFQTQQQQQQQQQQERRKRRKRRTGQPRDKELITIMVLVGLVCLAVVVGLVLVVRLLFMSVDSSMEEERAADGGGGGGTFLGGRFATDQRKNKRSLARNNPNNHHQGPGPSPSEDDEFPDLPPSKIYTIPHSMSHIGDRSDEYAELRKQTDALLPYHPERSLQAVHDMIHNNNPHGSPTTFEEDVPYDIYNCPENPPPNYPHEWKTMEILNHWSPEETSQIPDKIHQGLCVFDYRKDYVKALTYRNADVPFVVRQDPEVAVTVERWASPGYLERLMGNVLHRAEMSTSNHFMFWVPGNTAQQNKKDHGRGGGVASPMIHAPPEWSSPTKMIRMTFKDFVVKAKWPKTHHDPHWYFRLIGCGETGAKGECDAGSSEWLFDELTFFQPRSGLLYLKDPGGQRGIHCRIGMEGVTIANHFDQSRNAIVLLGGERRYILSHPRHCSNLALYPRGHPSARHSAVDWSNPDLEAFPAFADAMSNEILLQAGDVLYLPTNYFHYIVNLGLNYQCNTRSGVDEAAMAAIRQCGF